MYLFLHRKIYKNIISTWTVVIKNPKRLLYKNWLFVKACKFSSRYHLYIELIKKMIEMILWPTLRIKSEKWKNQGSFSEKSEKSH